MAEKKTKAGGAWDDYESPKQEALKKAQERVKEGGAKFEGKPYLDPSFKLFRPKDGDNQVRIVPPIEVRELGMFGADMFLHRNVGQNREVKLCLKNMWGEPCPRCLKQTPELWERAKEDEAVKEEAKSYFPEYKVLVFVIDRADEEEELKLWPMPKTIAEDILTQSNRKETQVMIDVAHPIEGRDIYFTRYKDKDWTKYKGVQIGENATPLPAWAASKRKRFDEIFIKPDYDEFAMLENQDVPTNGGQDVSAPRVTDEDDGKDELDRLDTAGLKSLISEMGLSIRIRKDWSDDDIRAAIRAEISPPDEEPAVQEAGEDEGEGDIDFSSPPDDIVDCFGVDFDQYEECDTCDSRWKARCKEICEEEKAKAEASKPKKQEKAKAAAEVPKEEPKKEEPKIDPPDAKVDRDAIMAKIKEKMAAAGKGK